LLGTSQLRGVEYVEEAINQLKSTFADISITVTPSDRSPFYNMIKYTEDDLVELVSKSDEQISRR
jgi:N-acylneuraminate cytidylyltransferase